MRSYGICLSLSDISHSIMLSRFVHVAVNGEMVSLSLSFFFFCRVIFHSSNIPLEYSISFSCGSVVKNPPVKQEMWVWPLGQEDPLKKEMATHSSILAWRIPWTEEPGGLQSKRSQRAGHDWAANTTGQITRNGGGWIMAKWMVNWLK